MSNLDGDSTLTFLQEAARCPDCGARLTWSGSDARCDECGGSFSAADGIPRLLPRSGAPPLRSEPAGVRDLLPSVLLDPLERYRSILRPTLTYKSTARSLVSTFASSFTGEEIVLNIGGGSRDYGPNVVNLDIEPYPGVAVIGVAERLPLADASCDGVILQAVLEHVVDENDTLEECFRVMRPSGRILVEIPFIQGDHPSPGDYRRYTEQGLRQIVERHGFRIERSGVAVGPSSALSWILAEYLALLVSFRNRTLYRLARLGTTFIAWPFKFLDRLLDRHPMAHVIASGVWVIGVKPQSASSNGS